MAGYYPPDDPVQATHLWFTWAEDADRRAVERGEKPQGIKFGFSCCMEHAGSQGVCPDDRGDAEDYAAQAAAHGLDFPTIMRRLGIGGVADINRVEGMPTVG